ncbi:MAG: hypothetical protein PHO30_04765, partial [Candidatus Omnitrophica bacterium]|nr:hypothetical protein [Candidatus Omnitrophota bacterium]
LPRPARRDDVLLFSESNSRFVVEVAPRHQSAFERMLKGTAHACVGRITSTKDFRVTGINGEMVVACGIDGLKEAWQKPLRW